MGLKNRFPFLYSPLWMVVAAFAVRALYILVARNNWHDLNCWEMSNIARSLATGHGFSSPFTGDTGPTAWTAPIYPWLMSLSFRTFGVFSLASATAMLLFNSVFAALTSWTVYRIALRVFNETVAVWSGWVWALFPYTIFWSVKWVWETSLTAFLLSVLFLLTLNMQDDDRVSTWFGYGLLWGVTALSSTSVLAWLPFSGCWLVYQLHRRGKHWLRPAIVAAVVFWVTITPWLVRNYRVFDKLVFIRGDLGVELRTGNNPLATGTFVLKYHPGGDEELHRIYAQMGEAAFDAEQAREAKEWMAENPGRFAMLTLRRIVFYWTDLPHEGAALIKNVIYTMSSVLSLGGLLLAVKRRVCGVFLFVTLVVFYPLIYYITFATPRYRHAIDPELAVLAVFLVVSTCKHFSQKRMEPARTFATGTSGSAS